MEWGGVGSERSRCLKLFPPFRPLPLLSPRPLRCASCRRGARRLRARLRSGPFLSGSYILWTLVSSSAKWGSSTASVFLMELGEQMRDAQENPAQYKQKASPLSNYVTCWLRAGLLRLPSHQEVRRAGSIPYLAELSFSFPSDKRGWYLLSSSIMKSCCKSQQIM